MKKLKKVISSFLVVAMILSMSTTAFAATNSTKSNTASAESTEGTMSREEALEILGMTEEEAEGFTLYEFSESNPNGRAIPSTINDGVYYQDMSISSGFTGAAHPCNGTKFKWGARLVSKGAGQFVITLRSYDSSLVHYRPQELSVGQTYQSDWINIYKGAVMYFEYIYYNYEKVPANFRLAVAVANV